MKTSQYAILTKFLILLTLMMTIKASPTAAEPELEFIVTAVNDLVDSLPGDGICETASGNGMCTLRAAIMEANFHIGADTIVLPAADYNLTIPGVFEDESATGDLDITESLTILGDGMFDSVIDAGSLGDRAFHILDGAGPVYISGLTIQNGSTTQWGGGILGWDELHLSQVILTANHADNNGGAIFSSGLLELTDVQISNNTTGSDGGGVYVSTQITMTYTNILSNIATGKGAGVFVGSNAVAEITNSAISGNQSGTGGGNVFNEGTLVITYSSISTGESSGGGAGLLNAQTADATLSYVTFRDNSGGNGGGLFNTTAGIVKGDHLIFEGNSGNMGGAVVAFGGAMYIEHSTVRLNTAQTGAGFYTMDGLIVITDSTVISNTAEGFGGGMEVFNGGEISIERVLVRANQAEYGGGIANYGGILHVINSTISRNNAMQFGGGLWTDSSTYIGSSTITANLARLGGMDGGGGGVSVAGIHSGDTYIKNTILYGNVRKFAPIFFDDDCHGSLTTSHYNLIGVTAGCTLEGSEGLDLIGIDPLLGTIQNNGGPTDTYALLDDSPAIDAANPGGCLTYTNFPLAIDQRGFPRPRDGNGDGVARCDIGAFEFPRNLYQYLPMLRK